MQLTKTKSLTDQLFETGPMFHALMNAKERMIVLQGGTYSGKTYTVIQFLFNKAIEKYCTITIVCESIPVIKRGCYKDALTIYDSSPLLQRYIKAWNKSERIIYFHNGSTIEFTSYETAQAAKAGKRDYLFVDEVNGVEYDIFWQLQLRTAKQVIVAYNPTARFYIHDKFIGTRNVLTIYSDYRHNPWVDEEKRFEIESIQDEELYKVYARGKTGMVTGIIYPKWLRIPDSDFPVEGSLCYGLDFGFTNDPSALVKTRLLGETVYFKELCYRKGMFPEQLVEVLNDDGYTSGTPVWCDAASPQMIAQLRRLGILALPAKKGDGSVMAGILKLRNTDVRYTESSQNMHFELQRYVFMKDKVSGTEINKPIDQFNHICDAARYAAMSQFFARG